MNILALISSVAVTSTAIVSPLPSDYKDPVPNLALTNPIVVDVNVLGVSGNQEVIAATSGGEVVQPTPSLLSSPLASTSAQKIPKKIASKIALLGDSMIDTLGPTISELPDELKKTFPTLSPKIYNYGVGGTNIDYGIERITHDYEYLGEKIPSLASIQPDIVVLESFAYNPYPVETGAIDRHWLQLARAVDTLRQSIPGVKIIIAATIAPNATVFGDGAPSIAFTFDEKYRKVKTIKEYLESTIRFAMGEHIPLANAYTPSLLPNGQGDKTYINAGDHIHPSEAGRKLFSQIVAQAIIDAKYLE